MNQPFLYSVLKFYYGFIDCKWKKNCLKYGSKRANQLIRVMARKNYINTLENENSQTNIITEISHIY